MAATTGDEWLEEDAGTFGSAGDKNIVIACVDVYTANNIFYDDVLDLDALCGHYISFTVFQFLAIISCSLAVAAIALACCRPVGSSCMSSRALGFAAGVLMGACVVHQVIALSLAVAIRTRLDNFVGQNNDISMGPTFGIAIFASIVALLVSGTLLCCSKIAGHGPIYECCHSNVAVNNEVVGGSYPPNRVTNVPNSGVAGNSGVVGDYSTAEIITVSTVDLCTHQPPSYQVHTAVA